MPTVEMSDYEFIFYIAKRIQRDLGLIQKYVIDGLYTSAINQVQVIENKLSLLRNSLESERDRAVKQMKLKEKEEKTK